MHIDHNTTVILESCDKGLEARFVAAARNDEKVGIRNIDVECYCNKVMQRADEFIVAIASHDAAKVRGT